MNKQEVYFKVRNHLLTQMKRSVNLGRCRYRGPNGLKCAIGCLIPDERYSRDIEGLTADSILISNLVGATTDSDRQFLRDLQLVHDSNIPRDWNIRLQDVAIKYGLEPIQTIVVDRTKWARLGAGKGRSELLNPQDNMCCLGFAAEQLGAAKEQLSSCTTPQALYDVHRIKSVLTQYIPAANSAMAANDLPMSGAMREAKIKAAFAGILNFQFKGLPDLPSDLLRVAVQDAMLLEKTPGFKLDMAGACMVKELDVNTCINIGPEATPEYEKLTAINAMRNGDFYAAIKSWLDSSLESEGQRKACKTASELVEADYSTQKGRASWKTYQKASRILREAGL